MIAPQASAGFVANMEDVLEVYQRPRDPQRPVVCLDETSKQMIVETRAPLPAAPGRKARHDYEYERNGVAHLFMMFAPLEGWRCVKVADRHAAVDYAHALKDLSDTHFPGAAKIVLVQVAAGRIPNTAGAGLDKAGVELDERGFVRVNERLETSAPNVWALGECAGSPMFTHISEDDFRIVRDNLAGGSRNTRDRFVPYCMFTDPPLAHVGLSEREAERQGVKTRVARLPTKAVLRAQATGQTEGFMKALVGENDDRILGFTMIGAEAGEVMAVVHTAMMADLPYTKLRDADFAHPTMAEGLSFLFYEHAASVRPMTVSPTAKRL